MIIELDSILGKCEFMNNTVWSVDISKRKQDFDCNAIEISLVNNNVDELELFNKLLEYVFSRKHIQDNYVALGLFETYIDFVNDEYYKNQTNKYMTCKDLSIPFSSLFHKFIDYDLTFNKEKFLFRGAILWKYLKQFNYQTQEQFQNNPCGENVYASDRYLVEKTNLDDFVANYMKSNDFTSIYCKNNFAVSISKFDDDFNTNIIGLRLVSLQNLYPLYVEIQEDFKDLNTTDK